MRLALVALLTLTCARPTHRLPLPKAEGYSTLMVGVVSVDSAVASAAFRAMVKADPHETAMCLYGTLEPKQDSIGTFWGAKMTRLTVAFTAWADSFHVLRATSKLAPFGCTDTAEGGLVLVGHAHSHPWSGEEDGRICEHSNDDQLVFHQDPRVIFSIVFCGDGSGQLQFRDGRRVPYRWAH